MYVGCGIHGFQFIVNNPQTPNPICLMNFYRIPNGYGSFLGVLLEVFEVLRVFGVLRLSLGTRNNGRSIKRAGSLRRAFGVSEVPKCIFEESAHSHGGQAEWA